MKPNLPIVALALAASACSSPAPKNATVDTTEQVTKAVQEAKAQSAGKYNDAVQQARADVQQFSAYITPSVTVPSVTDAPVMLYESWPQETTLDNANILDVTDAWLDGINSAQKTLDFNEFYTTSNGDENASMERVLEAIRTAAARGVQIRFIIDKKMHKDDNVETAALISSIPNVTMRIIDYDAISGGVQHSKFFIVDGKTAFFGSQNFDWRSLQQISEMGARLALPALVDPLVQVFELDWKLAQNPALKDEIEPAACPVAVETSYHGQSITVETVASPKNVLPCAQMWDLPKIISMIDSAKKSVAFQLLDYSTVNYDKTTFTELDEALQRAAARGVSVRMLVSDWSTANAQKMKDLKRLQQIPNIETKMLTVPVHSAGFVSFSRTIHSKFLVVDDDKSWLGTSNWSGDYFYASRNVGIIVTGSAFNADLTGSFDHYWTSEYVETVDPEKTYPKKVR